MSALLDLPPFAARDDARFLDEMNALSAWHLAGCADYRAVWPQCCHRTKGLERHHVVAVAANGQTSMFNLRRVCSHDHDLVTHRGYTLGPPNHHGKCQLIPPKPRPPDE